MYWGYMMGRERPEEYTKIERGTFFNIIRRDS